MQSLTNISIVNAVKLIPGGEVWYSFVPFITLADTSAGHHFFFQFHFCPHYPWIQFPSLPLNQKWLLETHVIFLQVLMMSLYQVLLAHLKRLLRTKTKTKCCQEASKQIRKQWEFVCNKDGFFEKAKVEYTKRHIKLAQCVFGWSLTLGLSFQNKQKLLF